MIHPRKQLETVIVPVGQTVLLTAQLDPSKNGIVTVGQSAAPYQRPHHLLAVVLFGDAHQDSLWVFHPEGGNWLRLGGDNISTVFVSETDGQDAVKILKNGDSIHPTLRYLVAGQGISLASIDEARGISMSAIAMRPPPSFVAIKMASILATSGYLKLTLDGGHRPSLLYGSHPAVGLFPGSFAFTMPKSYSNRPPFAMEFAVSLHPTAVIPVTDTRWLVTFAMQNHTFEGELVVHPNEFSVGTTTNFIRVHWSVVDPNDFDGTVPLFPEENVYSMKIDLATVEGVALPADVFLTHMRFIMWPVI